MILLSKYQILSRNNIYYIIPYESPLCPYCQGTLRIRDTKYRKAIESDGTVQYFCLRRLKCDRCGVMHAELPDILVPHKHYTRRAIESALSGTRAVCQAECSTIYRWNRERNAHIL